MSIAGSGFRAQVSVLLADVYLRVVVVTVAVATVAFALPLFTDARRTALLLGFNTLLTAGSAAACFLGIRAVRDDQERRFWWSIGASLTLVFALDLVMALVPPPAWGPGWDTLVNAGFLLYYAPLLVGLDNFASSNGRAETGRSARWIRPIIFGVTTAGWVTYAIVLPLADPQRSLAPGWDAYAVLDLVTVGALVGASRQNRPPRWNALQHWLLLAFGLATVINMADGLALINRLGLSTAPLLWALPHVAVIAAARLRAHLPQPDAPAGPIGPYERPRPASDSTLLVLAAFSLPVAHMLAVVSGLLSADVRSPQGLVVAVTTLLLGALAAAEYREIEVARTAMAQEQASVEHAIVQMQKMEAIGRLGSGIAHDYNNLLTAIGGYADIVVEGLPDSDPVAELLRHVRTSVDHASALTKQLLVVGRRQILNFEAVDIAEVIRDIPQAHRHILGERIDLRLSPSPDTSSAMVDPVQLEQVLLNLIVNARDAMPTGGMLRIASSNITLGDGAAMGWPESKPGSYVRIEVTDNGVGIPEHVLAQIYEPFFTTKPAGSGTGLGLALVYGIVRQSGGRLSVTTAVGKGTTFIVDLPAAQQAEAKKAAGSRGAIATGTETILVAEDEQAVRELVRSMLTMGGYQVLVAGSGEEALGVANRQERRIDLLLTDIVMPGMNGRELATRLTAQRPDTRVLFMTGYTDDAIVRHGVLGGAVTLLPKPFTRQDLLEAVRQTLDRPPARLPQPSRGSV